MLELFQRTSKGAILTEDDKLLLSQWKDAFRQIDKTLASIYQNKQKNNVTLSIALSSTSRGISCFWPHIDVFQNKYPEIILDIQVGELWDLRQKLLN